jgi:Ice-binding-like
MKKNKKQSEVKCGSVNPTKRVSAFLVGAAVALCLTATNLMAQAPAALAPIDLGSAGSFAVLGASTVTNTGPSIINGDLGVWPGTAYVPGTPSATVNGTTHAGDTAAQQAQASLTMAYNNAAGLTVGVVGVAGDLGGQTLTPGLYKSTSTLAITGDLTLNANGDPNAVFIFQVGSALLVATHGRVVLSGGAKAANVFWQVGSSATLGTYSALKGTVMAYASITIATGATLDGRALAQNAAVTLDTNAVTKQTSVTPPPPVPPTASAQLPVYLGSAGTFAVLGASTVTNTGPSVINGDLGVWPGTAYVPGTPAATVNGTIHALGDIVAQHAQASLAIAYNYAAGLTVGVVGVAGDLGGQTLAPGLYKSTSTLAITGDLTLDANGDPNAVFIFQIGSALTVATGGRVVLSGGAKAANVFWQVGSSATLGTHSALKGTVMAYASITIATGATLDGSALAQNAAVTLDTNAVTKQN